MIWIRGHGLSIRVRLRTKWQIYFIPDSGDGRMSMRRVIIAGRISVPKCAMRKRTEKKDFANTNETWMEEIEAMRTICGLNGIDPLVERYRSGRGAHLWIFFDKPIPASLARRFGFVLLEKGAEQVNLKLFKYYDRMLPAQDTLPEGGLGNLIALPLQGQALRKGNSAFIDSNWNAYPKGYG